MGPHNKPFCERGHTVLCSLVCLVSFTQYDVWGYSLKHQFSLFLELLYKILCPTTTFWEPLLVDIWVVSIGSYSKMRTEHLVRVCSFLLTSFRNATMELLGHHVWIYNDSSSCCLHHCALSCVRIHVISQPYQSVFLKSAILVGVCGVLLRLQFAFFRWVMMVNHL